MYIPYINSDNWVVCKWATVRYQPCHIDIMFVLCSQLIHATSKPQIRLHLKYTVELYQHSYDISMLLSIKHYWDCVYESRACILGTIFITHPHLDPYMPIPAQTGEHTPTQWPLLPSWSWSVDKWYSFTRKRGEWYHKTMHERRIHKKKMLRQHICCTSTSEFTRRDIQ